MRVLYTAADTQGTLFTGTMLATGTLSLFFAMPCAAMLESAGFDGRLHTCKEFAMELAKPPMKNASVVASLKQQGS